MQEAHWPFTAFMRYRGLKEFKMATVLHQKRGYLSMCMLHTQIHLILHNIDS